MRKVGTCVFFLACLVVPALAFGQVNYPPIADAGPDQSIYLGETAYLLGSATDPEGDPIVSWQWTIEAAPAGSLAEISAPDRPDPSLTPDIAGDYVLSLVVSDATGDSLPDTVVISAVENQPPTAVIVADAESGVAPLTVQFDGTQSMDPEGGPLSYDWNFRDGTRSSEPAPSHVFSNAGTYLVALTVIDERFAEDTDVIVIEVTEPVNEAPVADPVATPSSGMAPLTVQFAANAADPEGAALTFAWDFGDGANSTEENPSHVYTAPGTYTAWLTVSDGELTGSGSVTIVVDSAISMSVRRAKVIQHGSRRNVGTISLWADFQAPALGQDDVLAVYFDGIELFAAGFGEFHHGLQSNVYLLIRRGLLVRIDLNENRMYVMRHKLNIKPFTPENGVSVEMMFGDATAVETIEMTQESSIVWFYRRASVE